eukprot:TRINITY_DN7958_c0_g1_i1.p1 TRINITY_DN7958_c0_g1~~TRINITY_DN7958_c0_g1_i1.p1  ORF type:complete len:390 (+),score=56.38 TRINITY_DN7958_c0_g1_i1:68-1171(+)
MLRICRLSVCLVLMLICDSLQKGWYEYECQNATGLDDGVCEGFLFEVSNGATADEDRFPYIISLQQKLKMENWFNHFCGGILLENNLVLTVAHCLFKMDLQTEQLDYDMREDTNSTQGRITNFEIYAAWSPSCRHMEGKGRLQAVQYWIHPEYDGYSIHGNDIAILRLEDSFDYKVVRPRFDYERQVDLNSKSMTILGWGATDDLETDPLFSSAIVKNLQSANVSHTPRMDCQEEAQAANETYEIVPEQMLCFNNPASDTCSGDSGGPVLIKDCTGADVIVGLTSWGIDTLCTGQGFSGVYTDIAGYRDWIQAVVSEAANVITEAAAVIPETPSPSPSPNVNYPIPSPAYMPGSGQLVEWSQILPNN